MKIMLLDFLKVVNSAGGAERVFCNMANEFVDIMCMLYAVIGNKELLFMN